MNWINNLKIAIIEEDIKTASELIKVVPDFKTVQEAKEAKSLIKTAINIAKKQRQEVLDTMNKIKQTKKFLNQ